MANETPLERQRTLQKQQIGLIATEIGCVLVPFIFLIIFNFEEYFTSKNSVAVSAAFIGLIISVVLVIIGIIKDKIKLNLGSVLVALVVADGICWLLGDLINDLAFILLCVILGFIGALIFEGIRKKKTTELELLNKGIEKAQVDLTADEYKESLKNNKVKIRIKKELK